jgi:hypothetical protein
MTEAKREMDEAVERWLDAYRGHERYLVATENLFAVFARSWQGSRRYLSEGFAEFRTALLKEHGYKHLEVVAAFPKRSPERE